MQVEFVKGHEARIDVSPGTRLKIRLSVVSILNDEPRLHVAVLPVPGSHVTVTLLIMHDEVVLPL